MQLLNRFYQAEYFKPKHFVEVAGRGIFGKVNDLEITDWLGRICDQPIRQKSATNRPLYLWL